MRVLPPAGFPVRTKTTGGKTAGATRGRIARRGRMVRPGWRVKPTCDGGIFDKEPVV
jgi:hypothetical protein